MSQSLAKIYFHIIFSTKNREPFLLDTGLRDELYDYMGGILKNLQCPPVKIGGVEDHVHVLCTFSRTCTISDLVKHLKRSSSHWVKGRAVELAGFAWQAGYGIFSLGQSQLGDAKAYVANQVAHHRKLSFQDEYREFLRRYQVDFDERYVWD